MIRTLCAAFLVAIAALAGSFALSGTALAAPGGGGGCPEGGEWFLASTFFASDALDNGSVKDQNGDGLACFKVNAGQTEKHGGIPSFTWKDNTNKV